MGKASVTYDEIRFDVRNEHLTEVYVFCTAYGDCPMNVQGWHHKIFPAHMPTKEIMANHMWVPGEPDTDPVMWSLKAPIMF